MRIEDGESTRLTLPTELSNAVAAWRVQDPDPATRAELDGWLDAVDAGDQDSYDRLTDAFTGRLVFGTAGLRGELGPGPNRMNRVVVGQAAAALATHLLDAGLIGRPVLVGYDARHRSADFALDTAATFTAAGFDVRLTDGPVPTPVIAFGVRHLDCVAAVVVTASHNPRADSGYKVYLGDGRQIVPPVDAEIADRIAEVAKHDLGDVPRAASGWSTVGPELVDAYVERVTTLISADSAQEIHWVYTPLHGVGGELAARVATSAGFPAATVVAAQSAPDPDFPTLPFPNPEEPGVLDLAVATAVEADADLVIANDPDADRCAVAVPGVRGWRPLTGDELGALLADDALRRGVRGTYACSIVSSSLLAQMCLAFSQPFVSTLTGFKWIARVPGLVFGYEEALGYCCDPAAVADKDGLSALVTVLSLAARLKAEGQTLLDRLAAVYHRYGLHRTAQLSFRRDDPAEIAAAVERLRRQPPYLLLDQPVVSEDFAAGASGLPPTDALRLSGPSLSVVVRPSGTEPKLKCYLEVRLPVTESRGLDAAGVVADERLAALQAEVTEILALP